ncbi:hypothetical protein B7463_g4931, partial [Scytalidium lignicola]
MEPLISASSSSSGSFTSQSTHSMEVDSLSARNTPVRTTTPPVSAGNDNDTPSKSEPEIIAISPPPAPNTSADPDKEIVVDNSPREVLASPAIMVENSYEDEDSDLITPYQKRKRPSINYNLDSPRYNSTPRESPSDEPVAKRPKPAKPVRGCIIGVWRDSNLPSDEDKHAIYGFIDIHDRLRTRIYPINRRGEELIANIPTGAGGCWVTFPRIILDSHLSSLSPVQIKEYVKLRTDARPEPTPEAQREAEIQAVMKAVSIVTSQESSPPVLKTSSSQSSLKQKPTHRNSLPRQSLNHTPSFKAINASEIQTPKASPINESKPTGVLLGHWADSDEPNEADKHAVYGVLGGSDCFRVKVQRVTRDGRYVDGNFPSGAGALWLHYEKLVLDKHLAHLSRAEVKEYVRIRQRDMENGESPKDRKSNEQKAVKEAIAVAAAEANGSGKRDPSPVEPELRHSSRTEHRMAAKQQAEAGAAAGVAAGVAAEKARREKAEAREKQHEKARKEVAMAEAVLQEAAQQELKNNLKKLNKVWVAQQAAFSKPPSPSASDEVKYYNGIKYERKQNGPFQGKLVSAPQIFSIDGEDYVEYRVLTKPSFF